MNLFEKVIFMKGLVASQGETGQVDVRDTFAEHNVSHSFLMRLLYNDPSYTVIFEDLIELILKAWNAKFFNLLEGCVFFVVVKRLDPLRSPLCHDLDRFVVTSQVVSCSQV